MAPTRLITLALLIVCSASLTACGQDAESVVAQSASSATTAPGSSGGTADVAPSSQPSGAVVQFEFDGTSHEPDLVSCTSDPMTQSFLMEAGDLTVKLPYFPPLLFGSTKQVEDWESATVTWQGENSHWATGRQTNTESFATVTLEGEFAPPPGPDSASLPFRPFTLQFSCPWTDGSS